MGRVKKRKGSSSLFNIPVGTYDLWKPTLFVSPATWSDLMLDYAYLKRTDPLWAWRYEQYPELKQSAALVRATEEMVKNLTRSMAKRLEVQFMYGAFPSNVGVDPRALWAWTYEYIYNPRYVPTTMAGMFKEKYSDALTDFLPKETPMPTKKTKKSVLDTPIAATQSDLDFYKSRCAELERDKALLSAKIEALNGALAIVTKNATRSSDY